MRFERLAIEFPSGMKHIYLVERFIEEICDRYNIGNDFYGNITAAVMEAIENAITHGNKNNHKKIIQIRFEAKPGELIFEIQDEGEGFRYDQITDPTDTNTLWSGREGRGLFIIKRLADEVSFNENGNCITLHFRISGISDIVNIDRQKKMQTFKVKNKKTSHQKNR